MKAPALAYTSLESERAIDSLPVIGHFPSWLSGILIRNGPAKFEVGSKKLHWLDGLAMLHAFSFKGGKISYSNRFIRSAYYDRVTTKNTLPYRTFASDPCRSLLRTFFSYFFPLKNLVPQNTNVNITRIAKDWVALTEVPLSIRFDPKTLESLGIFEYEDDLKNGLRFETAHPHTDFRQGQQINYYMQFGLKSAYCLFSIPNHSKKRTGLAHIPVSQPAYMHSFSLTDSFAILTEYPYKLNPLELFLKRKPFILNFKWRPELGTRFIVIDRKHGNIREIFETDSFFSFHHINAFEKNNKLFVDLIAYRDPSFIIRQDEDMLLNSYKEVRRFELAFDRKKISHRCLLEAPLEMPHIFYQQYNCRKYRYLYGIGSNGELIKADLVQSKTVTWKQQDSYAGEPIFVPSPSGSEEDDGVVLSVILDAQRSGSFLLVLNARNFTELARSEIPHAIPFGLHGRFFAEPL
jgi:beta,beta-carotene 9',10'-dioxygenase